MAKVVCIIQARMGSTRLPGKSLMDLGGISLVESVHAGVAAANTINEIIVAIPENSHDNQLEVFLRSQGINVFRGSENDLVSRHFNAASSAGADFIVRIPGDNPLPHASEINNIVNFHMSSNPNGFSTNLSEVFNSQYPDGIGAEVFSMQILEEIYKSELSAPQREHLHLNFFNYEIQHEARPGDYPVRTINCPTEFARPDIILDINSIQDLGYFQRMFHDLGAQNPNIRDIIPWHDSVGYQLR
jgi:spore coat polysaccharide biosynthesis protein SpsF